VVVVVVVVVKSIEPQLVLKSVWAPHAA